MFAHRVQRKLAPTANADSFRLCFLYRTRTILAGPSSTVPSGSHHGRLQSSSPRKAQSGRNGSNGQVAAPDMPNPLAPPKDLKQRGTAPRALTAIKRREEGYDGGQAHSYARGASSQYRTTERPGRTRQIRPSSPADQKRKWDVPFEESNDPYERLRGSTMTMNELKRFESLFEMGISRAAESKKASARPHPKQSRSSARPKPEFPDLLRPLAEEAALLRAQTRPHGETLAEHQNQAAKSNEKAAAYLDNVKKLMDSAKFDTDLWQVLDEQVISKIKALELRDDEGVEASLQAAATEEKLMEFQLLAHTLPAILHHYMDLLQSSFAGSPLGATLLRTWKRLGSSAFTLGVTTDLYNQHMRILFKHYTDLDGVCDTLAEMDNEVYDFNVGTQQLLASIFNHANSCKRGRKGPGLQALWLTDRKARALVKLAQWKEVIDKKVSAKSIREARARAAELEEDDEAVD